MISAGDILRVRALSTGYRGKPVIDTQDLPDLEPGKVYSMIGPNAAGKSTLLRAIAGLLPGSGSIMLGETELLSLDLSARAQRVTYMPQTLPQGIGLTVLETVLGALHASPVNTRSQGFEEATRRAIAILEATGIESLAMNSLNQLSGGQRQLVSLAQALVREPDVLLLDEPISALDLKHQLRVMQLVQALAREKGIIAVSVLHDLQTAARWSDGIIVLSNGRVAASGSPDEAITPEVIADVYGVVARVERWPDGIMQVAVDRLTDA